MSAGAVVGAVVVGAGATVVVVSGVLLGGRRGRGAGGVRIRPAVTIPSNRDPNTTTAVPGGNASAVVGATLGPNAVRGVTSTVTATPPSVVTVHRPPSTPVTVPRSTRPSSRVLMMVRGVGRVVVVVGGTVTTVVGAVVGGRTEVGPAVVGTAVVAGGAVVVGAVVGVVTVGALVGAGGSAGREIAAAPAPWSEPLVAAKATPPLARASAATPTTDVTRAWRVARSRTVRTGCMAAAWSAPVMDL
jgi:hypothetical protein